MSHDTNRIYTEVSGGIRYGVSVADVQDILGTSKNDVGQLCTDGAINKWARYRPIEKSNFLGILTDTQRSAEDWGIGNIPIWTNKTIPQMVKFWIGGSGSSGSTPPDCGIQPSYWTKVLPSTYYRLRDFAADVNDKGYFHGAQAPISPFVGELAIPSTGQLDVIYPRGAESAETILLSDIGSFDDYYFGVIFAKSDFSKILVMTQQYAIGSSSWTQDFTLHIQDADDDLVPTGTSAVWNVFPILINTAYTSLTDATSSLASCTTVALLDYTEETITKNGVDYTFQANYASRENNSRIVTSLFQFTNGESDTLQLIRVILEYKTSLGEVVATELITISTVAGGTTANVNGEHQFNTIGIAASIYSVVAHIDNIEGRDFTVQWAEAVVNEIAP